ncbi:MAG: hypothetical protein KJ749_08855 [Planctomycetes bacterium]|nr:hypothetical protein [Planctomycetota bacterium]
MRVENVVSPVAQRRFRRLMMVTAIGTSASALGVIHAAHPPYGDPAYKTLEYGKSVVKTPPRGSFVDFTFEELPKDLKAQMYSYVAFSIQWEAHPQRRGRALEGGEFRVRVFAAYDKSQDDLIEYTWTRFGQNLRIVAGINAMRLDIDLDEVRANPELDDCGRTLLARTQGLVSRVIRLSGRDIHKQQFEVKLPWPNTLANGVAFSSAPDRPLNSVTPWHERVDVFVEDGTLSILLYKLIQQLGAYRVGSQWFSDDFRELVHRKAEEQGRVPASGTP